MNLVGEQRLQDEHHGYYHQLLVKQTVFGCMDCLNGLKVHHHCVIITSAVDRQIH
jgi:hypothetical protein